jgi:hypothetical protein
MEEIPIEEIKDSQHGNILKIFVYNNEGKKIKEDFCSNFLEVEHYVIDHNTNNNKDPYNVYQGTEFPPKGYKWDNFKLDWVELSLYEKYKRGQLNVPNDCTVINNIIVRKSLSQLQKEGLLNLYPTQKIDEELNIIIDKNQQELIDEGITDWEEIYKYHYMEFKRKLDQHIEMYYFKYPRSIISQFGEKTKIAKQWLSLNNEQREIAKLFNFTDYLLLISEFKNLDRDYTLDEIESELDELSKKIVKKNQEVESKLGLINNFFNSLHVEIEQIKTEKNFKKLFDFVANVESKMSQWIKS